MNRRLPPDAFAYYLGLGVGRSYQATANHFSASKQAVVNLANKEDWPRKLLEAERRVGEAAAKKAEESIEAMNERHLRSLRAIQSKALESLRSLALDTAMDAVRALDLAIRQERVIRGEPGDRSAVDIGQLVRDEHERWLTTVGDDADGADAPVEPAMATAPPHAPPPPADDPAEEGDGDADA